MAHGRRWSEHRKQEGSKGAVRGGKKGRKWGAMQCAQRMEKGGGGGH